MKMVTQLMQKLLLMITMKLKLELIQIQIELENFCLFMKFLMQ